MDKEYYKDIEKIKTIGSTYMAAVGLVPTTGTKVMCFYFLMPSLSVFTNDAKNAIRTHLGWYTFILMDCSDLGNRKQDRKPFLENSQVCLACGFFKQTYQRPVPVQEATRFPLRT